VTVIAKMLNNLGMTTLMPFDVIKIFLKVPYKNSVFWSVPYAVVDYCYCVYGVFVAVKNSRLKCLI